MRPYACALAVVVLAAGSLAAPARAQDPTWPTGTAWEGSWRGSLVNLPARPGAGPVDVLREVGPYPATDSTCSAWKTSYFEGGTLRGVKDYRLCRGLGADDLFVDEGDGIRLPARWLGDVLVTPFKYGDLLLIATTRVEGDTMLEEILTADDLPATEGVVPLRARGLQRLTLRRVPR